MSLNPIAIDPVSGDFIEIVLSALGVQVFIQDDAPAVSAGTKFVWIQTNLGDADDFTVWFDDGA